jgi:hypothetical protein
MASWHRVEFFSRFIRMESRMHHPIRETTTRKLRLIKLARLQTGTLSKEVARKQKRRVVDKMKGGTVETALIVVVIGGVPPFVSCAYSSNLVQPA